MGNLKRCQKCSDKRIVIVNGYWKVYGCFYPPYRGEWVAEIEKCPKEGAEDGQAGESVPG